MAAAKKSIPAAEAWVVTGYVGTYQPGDVVLIGDAERAIGIDVDRLQDLEVLRRATPAEAESAVPYLTPYGQSAAEVLAR